MPNWVNVTRYHPLESDIWLEPIDLAEPPPPDLVQEYWWQGEWKKGSPPEDQHEQKKPRDPSKKAMENKKK